MGYILFTKTVYQAIGRNHQIDKFLFYRVANTSIYFNHIG